MTTRVPVLTEAAVSSLRQRIKSFDPETLSAYRDGGPVIEDNWLLTNTSIEAESEEYPALSGSGPNDDAQDAQALHRHMPRMDRVQASDVRLWAYLAHGPFAGYCKDRWPLHAAASKASNRVLSAWLANAGSRRDLRRHALARLWWAAHLTHQPWAEDSGLEALLEDQQRTVNPYWFTDVMFLNQDLYQGLVERRYGGSVRLRTCILHVLKDPLSNGVSAPKKFIQNFLKYVHLLSTHQRLETLAPEALVEELQPLVAASDR